MRFLLRLALLAAIAGTLVLALMPSPPALLGPDTDPKKHAVGMLAVMTLAGLAFPQTSLLVLLASVAAGSGVLEFLQGIQPFSRDPDANDWIAGMIGALIAAVIVLLWRLAARWWRSRQTAQR